MTKTFEEQQKENSANMNLYLFNSPRLDKDGYPTEEALAIIKLWSYDDPSGWFTFIKEIWHMKDWGWEETRQPHTTRPETVVDRYYLSTGGWSGNEDIIRAMTCNNNMLWSTTWVSSRRGGHYVFEIEIENSNT